ncbi:MAG: transporter ATP-binding protein [Herbinix sp.]|jgi:putative ABC transport system ATP-binding protein|nr:transporter ATP-binding protein [Herbinix sp.]
MKTIVSMKQVSKVYGKKNNIVTALNKVSLTVTEGEFLGVMGPSGAGKSTLLNILATIDDASSGDVLIDGKDILTMSEKQMTEFRRNHLGFIFQDYNLLNTLTVKENILLPLALSKTDLVELEYKVSKVAGKLNITPILGKYPYEISGGEKQRTAAARAIIAGPSLLLADEPTGALDSKSSTELLENLSYLSKEDNTTILMVTHDAFAASYCSRVIFIKDGAFFTEIVNTNTSRKDFFNKILDVLSALGGGARDII